MTTRPAAWQALDTTVQRIYDDVNDPSAVSVARGQASIISILMRPAVWTPEDISREAALRYLAREDGRERRTAGVEQQPALGGEWSQVGRGFERSAS